MKYFLKNQTKTTVRSDEKQIVAKKLNPDFKSQLKKGKTGITGITK